MIEIIFTFDKTMLECKNIIIPEEELRKMAKTLVGMPVTWNFGEKIGIVVSAEYNRNVDRVFCRVKLDGEVNVNG